MDMDFKERFISLWKKYFNDSELPLTFYYTDDEGMAEPAEPGKVARCVISAISEVRKGRPLRFNADSIGCFGGKRYLGFSDRIMPDFEYFLSCGIPGKLEGERYKKSPEIVREMIKNAPHFKAPAKFIIFKRWDMLESMDEPEVAIFFAKPDVISGLFTLSNFDRAEPNGVFAPMGAGCNSIVQQPYLEKDSARPRGVLGMFDISARPYVDRHELTFSVPFRKLESMVENMGESFLTTNSWKTVQKRI